MKRLRPDEERPYVRVTSGGCWEWQRSRRPTGYGVIGRKRLGTYTAHRAVYEAVNGPIPDGLVIDHLCRNRPCVNPAHLEAVTFWENVRRGVTTKATWPQVLEIRRQYAAGGVTLEELGDEYGFGKTGIRYIVKGMPDVVDRPDLAAQAS